MHGALIVNFKVDVQNGVEIFIINRLSACLIVCLCLLAVDLGQALLLTLEFHTRRYDRLCILLPDGVLKRSLVRLWRLNFGQLWKITQEQCKRLLLGTQLTQVYIGGMCRKHLREPDRSDLALRRRYLR